MKVSVIIPWRSDGADRDAALDHVRALYRARHPEWEIVLGYAPAGRWCKAAAVAYGVRRAHGDVLVIADADVWCDEVGAAVAALEHHAWAIPHGMVKRLSEESSWLVYHGSAHLGADLELAENPYFGFAGGGIVALNRDLYQSVPLDPRFVGWGQEDESWAIALRCLAGRPWRGNSPLWHFWHQPQPRDSRRWGSDAGLKLRQRYWSARGNPDRMGAILAEAIGA